MCTAAGGESDSLNALDVGQCVDRITQNTDMIVGVKIRLSDTITDNGKNEQEAFRQVFIGINVCVRVLEMNEYSKNTRKCYLKCMFRC